MAQPFALSPAYYTQRTPQNFGKKGDADVYYKGCEALKGDAYDVMKLPEFWPEYKQKLINSNGERYLLLMEWNY